MLTPQGEGLASICFRVSDIARMHRRLDRLALKPDPVADVESRDRFRRDPGLEAHPRRDRDDARRADVFSRIGQRTPGLAGYRRRRRLPRSITW